MDIQSLTAELSVATQIVAADLRAIAEAGFRSVVCNRPDGEGADQPVFSEIEPRPKTRGCRLATCLRSPAR